MANNAALLKSASAVEVPTALLQELASKLDNIPDILKRYGVTPKQMHALLQKPSIRQRYKEQRLEWESPFNAAERYRHKATYMAEDGLLLLWAIYNDPEVSPAIKLDIHKHLVATSDAAPKKDQGGAPGSSFTVHIDLGDSDRSVTVEGQVVDPALENQSESV